MKYTPEEIGHQVVVAAKSVRARDPGQLAASVTILLQDNNWKSYVDPADGRPHDWKDFRRFVTTRLGTTVEALIGALKNFPTLAADVYVQASAPQGTRTDLDEIHPSSRALHGSTSDRMRRLVRDRPDLAAKVDTGVVTVYAASVEAGFVKPTTTVPVDSAHSAIRALLRRFTADELRTALERELVA